MKVAVKERNRDYRQDVVEEGARHFICLNVLHGLQQAGVFCRDVTDLQVG